MWSADATHEPIVSPETFERVRVHMTTASRPHSSKRHRTKRTYLLSGLVLCAVCGHRMQGNANHGENHYRCRFPRDFAPPPGMDHPPTVYLREAALVPRLDEWIATLFAPENLDETCRALAAAAGPARTDGARVKAAERKLADCDKRLSQYRKALDSGTDAAVVAVWISEVQAERLQAEQEIAFAQPRPKMNDEQVRTFVRSLGDTAAVLADADPKLKSQLYADLGISVTYDHMTRTATACAKVSVGGGT